MTLLVQKCFWHLFLEFMLQFGFNPTSKAIKFYFHLELFKNVVDEGEHLNRFEINFIIKRQ